MLHKCLRVVNETIRRTLVPSLHNKINSDATKVRCHYMAVNGYPTVLNIILRDWELSLVSRSRYVTINAFWHQALPASCLYFMASKCENDIHIKKVLNK